MVWYGKVRYGSASRGGELQRDLHRDIVYGMVWYGRVWYGRNLTRDIYMHPPVIGFLALDSYTVSW